MEQLGAVKSKERIWRIYVFQPYVKQRSVFLFFFLGTDARTICSTFRLIVISHELQVIDMTEEVRS